MEDVFNGKTLFILGEMSLLSFKIHQQDTVNFCDALKQNYPTLKISSKKLRQLLYVIRKYLSCNLFISLRNRKHPK